MTRPVTTPLPAAAIWTAANQTRHAHTADQLHQLVDRIASHYDTQVRDAIAAAVCLHLADTTHSRFITSLLWTAADAYATDWAVGIDGAYTALTATPDQAIGRINGQEHRRS